MSNTFVVAISEFDEETLSTKNKEYLIKEKDISVASIPHDTDFLYTGADIDIIRDVIREMIDFQKIEFIKIRKLSDISKYGKKYLVFPVSSRNLARRLDGRISNHTVGSLQYIAYADTIDHTATEYLEEFIIGSDFDEIREGSEYKTRSFFRDIPEEQLKKSKRIITKKPIDEKETKIMANLSNANLEAKCENVGENSLNTILGISITGNMAYRLGSTWVSKDQDGKLVDVSDFVQPIDMEVFPMPTLESQIGVGDLLLVNGEVVLVQEIGEGGLDSSIKALDGSGAIQTLATIKNQFMGQAVFTKLYNPMSSFDMGSNQQGGFNPMMFMFMGGNQKDSKMRNMMMLQMMMGNQSGAANQQFNPMMFMMMDKGGDNKMKDMMMFQMMMNTQQQPNKLD